MLAVPSVGIALVAAALAVPRAAEPRWFPHPVINPTRLSSEIAQVQQLAKHARAQPLPFSVREAGEMYRRLGRTQYEVPNTFNDATVVAWRDMLASIHRSLGDQPLLDLRAVQCELFVAALQHWEKSGVVPSDLLELGGDFISLANAHNWAIRGTLHLSEPERWAVALRRWTALAGLMQNPTFRLARELDLTQLRFFFEHPTGNLDPTEVRMRVVHRYAELELSYPANYAVGVVLAKAGRRDSAAVAFAKQLELRPDGPFALGARNHLIWATAGLRPVDEND
jgi:hypothetical protein